MQTLLDKITEFYELDQSTYLLIAFFCSWAAYFVRARIANVAFLMFLYPLFCIIGFTTYAAAVQLELFSPKRHAEWIMYAIFSAAIGAMVGISIIAVFRKIQDRVTTNAHIIRTAKRDEERAAKGYSQTGV
jgi:predicted membrane-bound spermidine synthase